MRVCGGGGDEAWCHLLEVRVQGAENEEEEVRIGGKEGKKGGSIHEAGL